MQSERPDLESVERRALRERKTPKGSIVWLLQRLGDNHSRWDWMVDLTSLLVGRVKNFKSVPSQS